MLASGLVDAQAPARVIRKSSPFQMDGRITGANINSYHLLELCSVRGRISVATARKLLDLSAEDVTKLQAFADKRGTVSYREAADVFHSTNTPRQVRVETVVEMIRSTDTKKVYPVIEELAKGGRQLTPELRRELGHKYGMSQEMLDHYYDIASALVKVPLGARVTGAIG
jgi:hypothetical protein